MSYLVVIEKTPSNYSAYVPDLPGCVATGNTKTQVRQAIRAAIKMHAQGLREDDIPLPKPTATAETIQVA